MPVDFCRSNSQKHPPLFIGITDRHYFGGDIILTPEQQATLEATSNPNDPFSPQNAVVRSTRSLWPSGRVPYIFDGSLSKLIACM